MLAHPFKYTRSRNTHALVVMTEPEKDVVRGAEIFCSLTTAREHFLSKVESSRGGARAGRSLHNARS